MKSLLAATIAVACGIGTAHAQYPDRPIRWVVPFPAGGTTDTNARTLTQQLERQMKASFVVDNRSGANGIIGTEIVAKAAADGHTLLHVSSSIAANPHIYKKLPYDTLKDLQPVTRIASAVGFLFLGSRGFAATNVKELVALDKKGERITSGSPGIGSAMHFGVEAFNQRAGTNLVHVPYKGVAPALTALIGNEVQVAFMPPTIAMPQVQAGKIRVLAFAGEKRWSMMPDVPTISETIPGLVIPAGWDGLFAPAGVPKDIVARLHSEVRKAIAVDKVREHLVSGGYEPTGDSPEEFNAFLRSEIARYGEMAKKVGLKPE
jgi:tripartite-type tricarboxylate transporter receptor subunit TctC